MRISFQHTTHDRGWDVGAVEEDEERGDDDDDESVGVWNLRRSSASALDRLSLAYGDSLLPILLPIVEHRLKVRQRPLSLAS